VACFSAGLMLFTYATNQGFVTSTITTVFTFSGCHFLRPGCRLRLVRLRTLDIRSAPRSCVAGGCDK
jgi:hypothetical protein